MSGEHGAMFVKSFLLVHLVLFSFVDTNCIGLETLRESPQSSETIETKNLQIPSVIGFDFKSERL